MRPAVFGACCMIAIGLYVSKTKEAMNDIACVCACEWGMSMGCGWVGALV